LLQPVHDVSQDGDRDAHEPSDNDDAHVSERELAGSEDDFDIKDPVRETGGSAESEKVESKTNVSNGD